MPDSVVDWLLEPADAAIRHLALRDVLRRPVDDPELTAVRAEAMAAPPIRTILGAQDAAGWWVRPGPGYGGKYTGTTWSLIFLEQMGADGADPGIARGCEYVLDHTQAPGGGFGYGGWSDESRRPPPSAVIHCLTGNLLRALIRFGWLDDPRTQAAIAWQAAAITGDGEIRWYRSTTSGPGFVCGVNEQLPCGWGAVKALRGLAAIPPDRRSPEVRAAIDASIAFLLSRDPAVADYPMGWGNTRPSGSWFKLGFPSGYVADVLQVLEVLCEVGLARDPRLEHALALVRAKRDTTGRWRNENPYRGKTWIDVDEPRRPSKWVTLRALRVLRAADVGSGVLRTSS
jgi:hypothetical protein